MRSQIIKTTPLLLIGLLCIGVAFYSVKMGVGSLYAKAVSNELRSLSSSLKDSRAEGEMEKKMQFVESMLFWDSDSPHALTQAGFFIEHKGRLLDDQKLKEQSERYFDQTVELRPLWPEAYIQKAYLLAELGASMDEVAEQIEKAVYVGPYERSTAKAMLNLYFANWEKLIPEQKIQVSRVLLRHGKYSIGYWELRQLISISPNKDKMCNLLKFNGINYRECQ
jgi:hypothetical protein